MTIENHCVILRLHKSIKIRRAWSSARTITQVHRFSLAENRIAVRKIPLTHLCVLGADVDRRNVIDDVLDSPAIHGLPVTARYVAIESRTPDRRRCGWSRDRFRLGGHAFGSPCFRPLPLARRKATGARKVQGTRHPRVSFVRAYVLKQNKTLSPNLPQNQLMIRHTKTHNNITHEDIFYPRMLWSIQNWLFFNKNENIKASIVFTY